MPHANARTERRLASISSRPRPLPAASLALSTALVLGACGGEAGTGSDGSADAAPAAASRAAATTGQPDGTLTLGDRTFAFRVTACDLGDAEAESLDETLRGTGTTGDDTRFTVVVDRGLVGARPIHTVSLHYGQVMAGSGFMADARRIHSELGWAHAGGDSRNQNEPLIQIEGRTVRAHGTFEVDDAGAESVVEGRLEVTCPPS